MLGQPCIGHPMLSAQNRLSKNELKEEGIIIAVYRTRKFLLSTFSKTVNASTQDFDVINHITIRALCELHSVTTKKIGYYISKRLLLQKTLDKISVVLWYYSNDASNQANSHGKEIVKA